MFGRLQRMVWAICSLIFAQNDMKQIVVYEGRDIVKVAEDAGQKKNITIVQTTKGEKANSRDHIKFLAITDFSSAADSYITAKAAFWDPCAPCIKIIMSLMAYTIRINVGGVLIGVACVYKPLVDEPVFSERRLGYTNPLTETTIEEIRSKYATSCLSFGLGVMCVCLVNLMNEAVGFITIETEVDDERRGGLPWKRGDTRQFANVAMITLDESTEVSE